MRETGIVNREICDALSSLGHTDEIIVCDAGFAIPLGVRTIDISLSENKPTVPEVLAELKKHFSVERVVIAEETRDVMPSRFKEMSEAFGADIPVDVIPHSEMRKRAGQVKAIIRTGDFSGFSNISIVSGGGDRWYVEKT